MNRKIVAILLFLGVLGIAAGLFQPAKLPRYHAVPDFTLLEQTGAPVRLRDLKGRVWLANFIYTNCPETCPMLSSRLADWQSGLLALGGDVRLVSFSVDPERDTPEVLRLYARRYNAAPRWLFLTGEREQTAHIARAGFLLGMQKGDAGLITHSTKIVLVDRHGVVRRYYEGVGGVSPDGRDAERERAMNDVRALLRE